MFGTRFCTKTACSAHVGPTPDLVTSSSSSYCTCVRLHTIDLLNTPVRRPSLSLLDPSKSSRRRILVRVSGSLYHPSENLNSSLRIRVRVDAILHPTRNPVVMEFGLPAQPESMIHWHPNPVVNEFGSESAAQSESHLLGFESAVSIEIQSTSNSVRRPGMIHRNTVAIESGSESSAQSILPGHPRSSSK